MAIFNDAIGKAFDWVRTQFEADEQIQPRSISDTVIPVYDVFRDQAGPIAGQVRWWKYRATETVAFNKPPSLAAFNNVLVQTPNPRSGSLTGSPSQHAIITRAAIRVEKGTGGWGDAFNPARQPWVGEIGAITSVPGELEQIEGGVLCHIHKDGEALGMPVCGYMREFVRMNTNTGPVFGAADLMASGMRRQILQIGVTDNNTEQVQAIGYFTVPGFQAVLDPDEHFQLQFFVNVATDAKDYQVVTTVEGFVQE